MSRRARWYQSVAGLGIEIETVTSDPELAWAIAGAIELVRGRPIRYRAMVGSGEAMGTGYGHDLGQFDSLSAAKDAVLRALDCVAEEFQILYCFKCARALDSNEVRQTDGFCVPCWWNNGITEDEIEDDEPELSEGDTLANLGLCEADFR